MSSEFYRAFEDEFRGGRELIKTRLEQYIPFLNPLKEIDNDITAIDLGCGRGEWLELLGELEIPARGVDLDDGMLAACRERNLEVETADAISYLKKLPNESVSIVSAFHLVEHIQFADLRQLVKESLRVLKPAGLLILETPNSENLVVGASAFYLDPTHERPIPPQLLEFLAKNSGFVRVKVLRLNEPGHISSCELSLLDVLAGVSPDYAVVAQKDAQEGAFELFDGAFEQDYGVSLEQLAMTYSRQANNREALAEQRSRADALRRECDAVRARLEQLAGQKGRLEGELSAAKSTASSLEGQLYEQKQNSHQLQRELDAAKSDFAELQRASATELAELQRVSAAELAEAHRGIAHWSQVADKLTREVQGLYSSRSWKVTWPLRQSGLLVRWIVRLPKRCMRWLLVSAMVFVIRRPTLSNRALLLLRRFPKFHQKLRQLAAARGLVKTNVEVSEQTNMIDVPKHLTSHARRIYLDLVCEKKLVEVEDK